MAETIDSLLVSLGLETDAKSFQKANDAIHGVKDGVLQLAAAAGVGMGLKALTAGVAETTLEMSRLSKITDFTMKQIDGLRFAMRKLDLSPDTANQIIQRIPDIQQRARQGELGDKAYWSGKFNPTEFAQMPGMDALKYLADAYGNMKQDKQRTLRQGIGAGDNDPLTRLLEGGRKGLESSLQEFDKLYKPIDPKLISSANEFNDQMAQLQTNFENLSRSMGERLLPAVNSLLDVTNSFVKKNPKVTEALLSVAGIGATGAAMGVVKSILPGSGGDKGKGGPAGAAVKPGKLRLAGHLVGGVLKGAMLYYPIKDAVDEVFDGSEYKQWADSHGIYLASDGALFFNQGEMEKYEAKQWALIKGRKKEKQSIINKSRDDFYKDVSLDGILRVPKDTLESSMGVIQHAQSARRHNNFSQYERKYRLPAGLLNATYQQESGGGKYLVSPRGALGPFGIMPGTAHDLGLHGNDVFDLNKSSEATAKYYRMLIDRYHGDLPKAVAAYNWGMGHVDKFGLSLMPKETQKYLPAVLKGVSGWHGSLDDYAGGMSSANTGSFAAMQNYYALMGAPPTPPTYAGGSGDSHVHQTNHIVIHAPGGDPAEIDRRLSQALTTHSQQAQAMLASDLF